MYFNDTMIPSVTTDTISWIKSGDNTVVTHNGNSTTIRIESDGTWTRVS